MSSYKKLTPNARLLITFIAVSLFTTIAGIAGIKNLNRSNELASALYAKDLLGTAYAKDANIALLNAVRDQKNLLLAQTETSRQECLAESRKDKARFAQNLEKAKSLFYSEDGKDLLRKIDQVYGEWDKFDQRVAAAAIVELPGGKKASPALISMEGRNRINILQGLFQELSAIKGYHASRTVHASEAAFRTSTKMLAPAVSGGILLVLGLGFRLVTAKREEALGSQ